MSSEEIWEYDKIKIDSIVKEGYEVLVIWESDYKENKELAIQKCINFINS
jgi:G:T-mismatch repair DNA endonuclease (very short patch repair protein)